jgi:ASC-1-like (ASCH) protein
VKKLNREIKKKTWPEYFERVLSGKKKVELRLADFEAEEGDILVLEEYDPQKKEYTGRTIKKKISYLMNTKTMESMNSKEEIEKNGFFVMQMEDSE